MCHTFAVAQGLMLVRRFIKVLAYVVGGLVTWGCTSALLGGLISTWWIRWAIALVFWLLVPAFIIDRALPEGQTDKTQVVYATDLLALLWVAPALVLGGLAQPLLAGSYAREARRFSAGPLSPLAWPFWTLGAKPSSNNPKPVGRGEKPEATTSAGSQSAPNPSGSIPPTRPLPSPSASAPSAAPSVSASAPPAASASSAPALPAKPPPPVETLAQASKLLLRVAFSSGRPALGVYLSQWQGVIFYRAQNPPSGEVSLRPLETKTAASVKEIRSTAKPEPIKGSRGLWLFKPRRGALKALPRFVLRPPPKGKKLAGQSVVLLFAGRQSHWMSAVASLRKGDKQEALFLNAQPRPGLAGAVALLRNGRWLGMLAPRGVDKPSASFPVLPAAAVTDALSRDATSGKATSGKKSKGASPRKAKP